MCLTQYSKVGGQPPHPPPLDQPLLSQPQIHLVLPLQFIQLVKDIIMLHSQTRVRVIRVWVQPWFLLHLLMPTQHFTHWSNYNIIGEWQQAGSTVAQWQHFALWTEWMQVNSPLLHLFFLFFSSLVFSISFIFMHVTARQIFTTIFKCLIIQKKRRKQLLIIQKERLATQKCFNKWHQAESLSSNPYLDSSQSLL